MRPDGMDKSEEELNAIVGAALKGLVGSGASSAAIGAFAAEFREEVAAILGHQAQKPQAPDLLALVTQAVQLALEGSGAAPRRSRAHAKRIYVECNGHATSVSLPQDLLDKLDGVTGSRKQTVQTIKDIARAAPEDVANRSRWVRERALSLSEQAVNPMPQH